MTRRRWLTLGAVVALVAVAGGVFYLSAGRDDEAADAGIAAGEGILREQQQRERREQTDALQRRLNRLERKAKRERAESGAAGGTAGGSAAQRESFSKLASGLSGSVGAAFGRPGLRQPATVLGDWSNGPAWSTIKVPIAVATVRHGSGTDAQRRAAITASDNAAAEALWSSLGSPATAGRKTEAVLADAGDDGTDVQTRKVRPGFTAFGQTDWTLAAQQTFAAGLGCIDGADPILDLMGQVGGGQSWGLGQAGAGQRFKGGWGPDSSGSYLVRQFGLIDVDGGTLAVALAAKPADGSFATGQHQMNALADWVARNASGAGSPRC